MNNTDDIHSAFMSCESQGQHSYVKNLNDLTSMKLILTTHMYTSMIKDIEFLNGTYSKHCPWLHY